MEKFDQVIKELKIFLNQNPPPEEGKVAYFLSVNDAKTLIEGFEQVVKKLAVME